MIIETLKPMTKTDDNYTGPGTLNPFRQDLTHMGTNLGTNVVTMFPHHDNTHQPYIILVDVTTGERLKVSFPSKG